MEWIASVFSLYDTSPVVMVKKKEITQQTTLLVVLLVVDVAGLEQNEWELL